MYHFRELIQLFSKQFEKKHFPEKVEHLYHATNYFLQLEGKRIRPVLCLMGNELFDAIHADTWKVAAGIELFHNFTLIHDDIMDKAPLRRGVSTVHHKYGESTAILAGDVMLIKAYEYISSINTCYLSSILNLFNYTATQVCEGQQMDMNFEMQPHISLQEYIEMITFKTSVLLACSLQMGAILGGASEGNQHHLYEFGKNLGIAFQIQDDYLDAFGNPDKFGKQIGGDITANKKTFLLIHALEACNSTQKEELKKLMVENPSNKIEQVLSIFKMCKVDEWAKELKEVYFNKALQHLESVAVTSTRKKSLQELAEYLIQREV